MNADLRVKVAAEGWEFEQIFALNHQTFAEEIPQHPKDPSGRLIDRFHDENTYVIGLRGRRLAGMIAVRGRRPFSLDQKLPDLDAYLPGRCSICELRLLAIEPRNRAGRVLPALIEYVWRYCVRQGYDVAVISGTTRQLRLYRRLGFVPFGPLVGTPGAEFQPMMLTAGRFAPRAPQLFRAAQASSHAANFLPGPVTVHDEVIRALRRPAESHRSAGFATAFTATRTGLCRLTGAARVELLLGSGTLANDAIAGQLSVEAQPGLVLSNGEFGERLVDHARRWRLGFDVVAQRWGGSFNLGEIERRLAASAARWLWFVHCETSTGVLNNFDRLQALCSAAGVKLCVDAVSSIGNVPLNLGGTYLASGVSGKGLGAFSGLAMLFYNHHVSPAPGTLPRYLDLGLYARDAGIPFTQSSNLVRALHAALERVDWPDHFRELADASVWLRARLRRLGFDIIAPEDDAAPGVLTIPLPATMRASAIAEALETQGYLVSVHSRYLLDRNWLQICLMGAFSREQLVAVSDALAKQCGDHACAAKTRRS